VAAVKYHPVLQHWVVRFFWSLEIMDCVCFSVKCKKHLSKFNINNVMKGKALRKHSLHEKTAASVLLKLFISGNE